MKQKTKDQLEKMLMPQFMKASLYQIQEKSMLKFTKGYIKFLEILFKITSTLTLFAVFVWYLPVYLKMSEMQTLIILMLVILTHLRFGKTDVIMHYEE